MTRVKERTMEIVAIMKVREEVVRTLTTRNLALMKTNTSPVSNFLL